MSVVKDIIELPNERNQMAQFYVENIVRFVGTVEADSQAQAEEIGYYYDNLEYDSVVEVDVEEIEGDEDE
jgi:hypothetical protein